MPFTGSMTKVYVLDIPDLTSWVSSYYPEIMSDKDNIARQIFKQSWVDDLKVGDVIVNKQVKRNSNVGEFSLQVKYVEKNDLDQVKFVSPNKTIALYLDGFYTEPNNIYMCHRICLLACNPDDDYTGLCYTLIYENKNLGYVGSWDTDITVVDAQIDDLNLPNNKIGDTYIFNSIQYTLVDKYNNQCTFYGNGKYVNVNQQSNKVESVTDFTPRQLETLNKLITQS